MRSSLALSCSLPASDALSHEAGGDLAKPSPFHAHKSHLESLNQHITDQILLLAADSSRVCREMHSKVRAFNIHQLKAHAS